MNHPPTAVGSVDQHAEQNRVRCFLAVQPETAASCLHWEVLHGWTGDDPGFRRCGTVILPTTRGDPR